MFFYNQEKTLVIIDHVQEHSVIPGGGGGGHSREVWVAGCAVETLKTSSLLYPDEIKGSDMLRMMTLIRFVLHTELSYFSNLACHGIRFLGQKKETT